MRTFWSRRLEDLRVLCFAATVPLILRLRKLPGLPAWLEPAGRAGVIPSPPSPSEVDALVRRVDRLIAAGRPFVRYGCLVRGLTLYRFLRRAGAEVSLRFGVGMMGNGDTVGTGGETDGGFAAHCWVVYQGEPLAEPRDPRPLFQETWRIEPGTP